jgi:pimeloyl-ACP methyl ester carboxylesterase
MTVPPANQAWGLDRLPSMNELQILVQGRHWNVLEAGSGPPIVFLHNGGGTLWNWAHQLEHFSTRYRVIAPDLPGFGRSYRPTGPLTLESYVQGLEDLLKVLDCSKPILVGNCIGASVALEYTLRRPERVAAMALFNVCGGLPMLNPNLRFWAGLRPNTSLGRALHRYLINAANHPVLEPLSARLIYGKAKPSLHPKLEQFTRQQRQNRQLRASLYNLAIGLDSFSVFSGLREKPSQFPPVLLGWGAQNRTLNVGWTGVLAEWIKPERLWIIEGCGHLPMYEQPEQVNRELEGFLHTHLSAGF